MNNILVNSAVGVVCIVLAMTFSLTSCQHGDNPIDQLTGANTAHKASDKDRLSSTASADSTSPEARRRQMQAFFARADVRQMSQGLEELAQVVAVVVDDEAVRNCVYERCMERFDGETNVLWKHLDADSRVRGAGGSAASWSERVERVLAASRLGNGAVRAAGGVQAAVAKFEGITSAPLHLFWMYPSRWDRKTTPLVAFVPFDVDPDTRKSIPAFDSKGNRYELDREGKLAKERPVAVITFNERTNLDGKVRIDKFRTYEKRIVGCASCCFM